MSSKNSFTVQSARATSAIAGIQKYFSTTASLVLAGTTYTPAQVIALLQAFADALKALMALHALLKTNVGQVRAQRTQVDKILQALATYVDNLFGSDPGKLADFGLSPRKVGVKTAATKASSAAKSKATRLAKKTALAAVKSPAPPAPATGTTTSKS
jgi:hypothetical protein